MRHPLVASTSAARLTFPVSNVTVAVDGSLLTGCDRCVRDGPRCHAVGLPELVKYGSIATLILTARSCMFRRQRRWLAGMVMLGVVFAQMVTVAHACNLAVPMSPAAAIGQAADETMPSDCAAMDPVSYGSAV